MTTNSRKPPAIVAAVLAAFVLVTGCPPPPPPPVSVLQGTWELTPAPANVTNFFVTFDDDGDISQIQYIYTEPGGNVPVTVTIDDPEFVDADSTVDGSDVSIRANWAAVNNLQFNGTLNESQDQITGTATYFIQVGNVTVSLPTTNAQLTKQ